MSRAARKLLSSVAWPLILAACASVASAEAARVKIGRYPHQLDAAGGAA